MAQSYAAAAAAAAAAAPLAFQQACRRQTVFANATSVLSKV